MWTEVAPVIMEKTGPRRHSLLSRIISIMTKRRPSILQAQVRRMVVSSFGWDEPVKSFHRIGKTIFNMAASSISTQYIFLNPQSMKSCQICTSVLEIGRKMLTCQVAQKDNILKKWNLKNIWDEVFVSKIPRGSGWVTCMCLWRCIVKSVFCWCLVVAPWKKAWLVPWSLESYFLWSLLQMQCLLHILFLTAL